MSRPDHSLNMLQKGLCVKSMQRINKKSNEIIGREYPRSTPIYIWPALPIREGGIDYLIKIPFTFFNASVISSKSLVQINNTIIGNSFDGGTISLLSCIQFGAASGAKYAGTKICLDDRLLLEV
jgi:hypothetical protein